MRELIGTFDDRNIYVVGKGIFGAEIQLEGSERRQSLASFYKFAIPELSEEGRKFLEEFEKEDA